MNETEYLIIGAGPTGLGAACRLQEKGVDWHLLEADARVGGLAGSWVDAQGFTWDKGGHVQFSHYDTFDRYMNLALGADGWLEHQRESWVWVRKRFVPYPFQNNLHRLDPEERWACVEGLLEAAERASKEAGGRGQESVASNHQPSTINHQQAPSNFEEWMLATFGPGITEIFMYPYNFKVWAYPPHTMEFGWIGERVSVPKLASVLRSVCTNRDEVSWGPNRVFRFPLRGGTGSVWEAIGRMLEPARMSMGCAVEHVDAQRRVVRTAAGAEWKYRRLISTMPLDALIARAPGVVDAGAASGLVWSATHIIGVGMQGRPPASLKTKCWMYFPESNSPYYRVTVFSNYSPNNVARPGEQWSLMTETAESPVKPVRRESLAEETLLALEEDGLLPDRDAICSVEQRRIPQGYPTPFLGRDAVVDPILRAFERNDVYSRGRFGAWKYEVSNQDHSFAQGYECVERLSSGGGPELEPTLFTPRLVNSRRNP